VRRRDTINNQSTAREFEDGKQIFAAFNGGLSLRRKGGFHTSKIMSSASRALSSFFTAFPQLALWAGRISPASLAEHSESTCLPQDTLLQ
jgi:hypothetical protein